MIEAKETFAFQQLDVYVAAKEFARLVENARISDKELRDQATRAAKSTFCHLCEGLPNSGTATLGEGTSWGRTTACTKRSGQ